MKIPSSFTQGELITWEEQKSVSNLGEEISSPGWSLKYFIRGKRSSLDLEGTPDDDGGWSFEISPEQSKLLKSGQHFWQSVAEKDGRLLHLSSGQIEVKESFSLVTGEYDGRSQVEIDLENVQKAIRALINGGAIQQYSIGGRSFTKMTLSELKSVESKLKYELAKERAAKGGTNPFKLLVRF